MFWSLFSSKFTFHCAYIYIYIIALLVISITEWKSKVSQHFSGHVLLVIDTIWQCIWLTRCLGIKSSSLIIASLNPILIWGKYLILHLSWVNCSLICSSKFCYNQTRETAINLDEERHKLASLIIDRKENWEEKTVQLFKS